jgi:8-oxo-dGTP diphosphatase
LCLITRSADRASGPVREVLLGYKKTGFGAGRWVGVGGHIEDGEKPADAAAREVAEETSLIVPPDSLRLMACIAFAFPARPTWDQTAEVFVTDEFSGEPAESDELIPKWFDVAELPFDGMWDDARYWVPIVLGGEQLTVTFTFAADCATVAASDPVLRPPTAS